MKIDKEKIITQDDNLVNIKENDIENNEKYLYPNNNVNKIIQINFYFFYFFY